MARLAAAFLAMLTLAGAADAAQQSATKLRAPTGLRGFLLRPNEPETHVFSRTPAFAWNPVRGAKTYEFVLSTSPLFAGSGLVYANSALTSPAASVPLTLPWITGEPYSLYARVRAIGPKGAIGAWSTSYGFNMRWPTVPQPLASGPGFIRWTPIDGATSYDVWYGNIDTGGGKSKIFSTTTNVADQREYWTFHQTNAFTGTVLWRVRAVRRVDGAAKNGLPAVSYGPWSPIYTTTNGAFTYGPLTLTGTTADTTAVGQAGAHQLMPAFQFSGDQSLLGAPNELYRVYVFTDQDCLNVVFKGAIVGSPAYAPRTTGPLGLPNNTTDLALFRTSFMPDGAEPKSTTFDGVTVATTESLPPSVFTAKPITTASTTETSSSSSGTSSGSTTSTTPTDPYAFPGSLSSAGAPIDLWDTNWPQGRYWWTVVPVKMVLTTSTTGTGTSAVTTTKIDYVDAELAQDACATGRVASFGKQSQPTVTAAGTPYASGLSPKGRLLSATKPKPVFFGAPLIAWTTALGASAYEVQWSKKRYPWRPIGNKYTFSTSASLPLTPGTWHYRVRGIDLSLPTGAQQMAWSTPVALVVAKPKFRIVP
jgi:hypothetical protein